MTWSQGSENFRRLGKIRDDEVLKHPISLYFSSLNPLLDHLSYETAINWNSLKHHSCEAVSLLGRMHWQYEMKSAGKQSGLGQTLLYHVGKPGQMTNKIGNAVQK